MVLKTEKFTGIFITTTLSKAMADCVKLIPQSMEI